MEMIFINTEGNKMDEPHKFVFNLSLRSDLKSSNKHVALQNLSICYTWRNIRKHHENNRLQIIVPIWNDEFELPDDSNSAIHILHNSC